MLAVRGASPSPMATVKSNCYPAMDALGPVLWAVVSRQGTSRLRGGFTNHYTLYRCLERIFHVC